MILQLLQFFPFGSKSSIVKPNYLVNPFSSDDPEIKDLYRALNVLGIRLVDTT